MKVRLGRVGDARELAEILVSERRRVATGLLPDTYLASLDVTEVTERFAERLRPGARSELLLVAESEEGRISGYAYFAPPQQHSGFDFELHEIYLRSDQQRKGLGRRLVFQGLAMLGAVCKTGIEVWVLDGNPNISFYPKVDAVRVNHFTRVIGGKEVGLSVFYWPAPSPTACASASIFHAC